jgi:hypothetical protein
VIVARKQRIAVMTQREEREGEGKWRGLNDWPTSRVPPWQLGSYAATQVVKLRRFDRQLRSRAPSVAAQVCCSTLLWTALRPQSPAKETSSSSQHSCSGQPLLRFIAVSASTTAPNLPLVAGQLADSRPLTRQQPSLILRLYSPSSIPRTTHLLLAQHGGIFFV